VALFNISVQSWLNLPESVRLAIVKMAVDTGRVAAALETLVAKVDEPEPPGDEMVPRVEVQAKIDELAAKLTATRLHSEAEVRRLTVEGASGAPPAIL